MDRSRGARLSSACGVALAAAFACGPAGEEIEVIHAVPPYVLGAGEVAHRVKRAPFEIGTELSNLRVVGYLVRKPAPCEPEKGPWACPQGAEALHWFADTMPPVPGEPVVAVELLGGADAVEVGGRYVLWGSADMAPDAPGRWVLRAKVLAAVK